MPIADPSSNSGRSSISTRWSQGKDATDAIREAAKDLNLAGEYGRAPCG